MPYRAPEKDTPEWKAQKLGNFKIVIKDGKYAPHKDSARFKCLELAKAGMKINDWTKLVTSKLNYTAKFAIDSLHKHRAKDTPVYDIETTDDKGNKLADVMKPGRAKGSGKPKAKKPVAPNKKAA